MGRRAGSVVVVDAGPVGIVTETDALCAAYRRDDSLSDVAVTAVTSRNPATTARASVTRALETTERRGVKRLPVRDGVELVGVVTTTDVARHQPEVISEVRDRLSRGEDWSD